jgi:hypothetical protein
MLPLKNHPHATVDLPGRKTCSIEHDLHVEYIEAFWRLGGSDVLGNLQEHKHHNEYLPQFIPTSDLREGSHDSV